MQSSTVKSEKNYNNYSAWLRNKYNGKRVYKVIVDAGFTCPNRDGSSGYGGCSYCNTDSFTPVSRNLESIREQVLHGMKNAADNYKAELFIVYFQPNSNTYAPVEVLKEIYDEALSVNPPQTVGLAVGTRPDCLNAENIALLEEYTKKGFDVDLEIGIESIYNSTLQRLNRGCTHEDFKKAMQLLQDTSLNVCVHTILGLPGETREMMLAYAEEINKYPQIKFVKFHHLHIVKGSILGVRFKRNPFPMMKVNEYIDLLCQLVPKLRPNLVIQRLFSISHTDILIAPWWGLRKGQIQYLIDTAFNERNVLQGKEFVKEDF